MRFIFLVLIFSFNLAASKAASLKCVVESQPFETAAVGECPDCANVKDKEISKLFEVARNIRMDAKSKLDEQELNKFTSAFGEFYSTLYPVRQDSEPTDPDSSDVNVPAEKQCGLTNEEVLAIKYYTGSGYTCINGALRGHKLCSSSQVQEAVPSFVRVLNSALSKIQPYEGDVYRGALSLPESVLAAHKEGRIVRFSSYVSTSATEKQARGWSTGKFLYRIKHKTGVAVSPLSVHKNESEILFQPNTAFKINSIETEGPLTIFNMEEI